MDKYKRHTSHFPLYKCRLCGEVFTDTDVLYSVDEASHVLTEFSFGEPTAGEPTVPIGTEHRCDRNRMGFADFIGFDAKYPI